jgi:drug/metabolite transporter (DMT)-like permease
MSDHRRGLLLTSLGVVVITPDATLVRLVDAPSLTTSLWRSGLTALSLVVFLAVRYGRSLPRQLIALGGWGVVASVLSGMGSILFVVAVNRTSVANVLLILALTPIWAALISKLALGDGIPVRTLAAMPFAVMGVAIAVSGSVDGVIRSGDLFALWTSLGLAANMTIVRARRDVDMVPTAALGAALGFAVLVVAGTAPTLTAGDLPPLLLLGLVVIPGAMGLITAGARYLSSAETTLLLLGETAASPVLAALVVDEPLGTPVLVGGGLVLGTLLVQAWLGLRATGDAKRLG